jgi:hypothetical protein
VIDKSGIVASCHCGKVTIGLSRKPDYINQCNCSLCKKLGWRLVYSSSEELRIEGEFDDYVRSDMADPMIRIRRCASCGCPTHWELLTPPPHERVGVNALLLGERALDGVETFEVDGASRT